jgi:hypothetical protein
MVKPPNAGCVVSAKPPTLTWMNVPGFEQTGAPNTFTVAREADGHAGTDPGLQRPS